MDEGNEATLKEFLSEKLGVKAEGLFDQRRYKTKKAEDIMDVLATMMVADSEDGDLTFDLKPKESVSDEEIQKFISEYYSARGYEVGDIYGLGLKVKKGKNRLGISISNYGHRIIISLLLRV